MKVSMEDPDFRKWLGTTIGVICQEAVDVTEDAGESMKKVMSAIGDGLKGKT